MTGTEVARAVFWTAMLVWGLVEFRHSRVLGTADRSQDRGTYAWSLGAVLVGLAVCLLLDAVVPGVVEEDRQTPFLLGGAALVVGGIAFRLWAIRTLGRFFTFQVTTASDQRVVTDGPYRWLCHPSYTGLLVGCLGAGVASANIASLIAVLAIPLYGLVRRIRVEEAALIDALGDPYRQFVATRKRLVPGIW